MAVPFYQTFESDFEPLDAQTRLAIFSDDGCDVWIDQASTCAQEHGPGYAGAERVAALAGHLLDFAPQSGCAYRIKVDYSNTIHLGQTYMDGVTLFAYTFDPTSNEEPDITLSFPKSVYRMGEITRAQVEVSGPPSLLDRDVMMALDGPGQITPQRFPMSVGSTRFVQVTMPMVEGQHSFRARIEGQSALDEAAVGISVFDERGDGGDSGWHL